MVFKKYTDIRVEKASQKISQLATTFGDASSGGKFAETVKRPAYRLTKYKPLSSLRENYIIFQH